MRSAEFRGALRDVDASTPAVVLGVHDHNGLSQIRTLGRLGVPVYITHTPGRTPATYSRFIHGRFEWEIDAAAPHETVAFLLEVVGPAVGRRAVLFSSEDGSSIVVAEQGAALREWFITPDAEPSLNRALVDKQRLHELCRAAGVPSPKTVAPSSQAEVEAYARDAAYPVVVKAKDGWRLRGLSDVVTVIARDREELLEAHGGMTVDGEPNVVLQDYIPGGPSSVWIFNGYADRAGNVLAGRVGNKLREYPVDRGLTTLGVNRPNEAVLAAVTAFVRKVGYRGVIDVDIRLDERDGRYKPIDFNPRPGATFRLFADDAGIDVVRAAYLDLTGQRVPLGAQRVGRRWMVENWDLAAGRRYLAAGRLTLRGYLRSLRGVQEGAWSAHDDPLPFGMMLVAFGRALLPFVGQRLRRRSG